MAEAGAILDLIDRAARSSREQLRDVIEGHLDASERVVANVSVMRTIRDGSNLLDFVMANPQALAEVTKANPT